MSYAGLATRRVLLWVVIAVLSRLTNAMAPLALVFAVRELPDGYALGASLAGAYIGGEVVGAAALGVLSRQRRVRRELFAGLVVSALAFGALAAVPARSTAAWLALAALAGAAPALGPGGLRSVLTRMVEEADVARALSAEAVLNELIWAAAPVVVVFLSVRVWPGAPLLVGAGCSAAAGLFALALPATAGDGEHRGAGVPLRALAAAWPTFLVSAAALSLMASLELVLPTLIEYRDLAVGWSGPLLSAFMVASCIGALCYGARSWPGSPHRQGVVLLLAAVAAAAVLTVASSVVGIAAALVVAGVLQSGVMVSRSLALRRQLPPAAHTAGYSMMHAVQGVGYSATAVAAAALLSRLTPPLAIGAVFALAVLLIGASVVAEHRAPYSASLRDPH